MRNSVISADLEGRIREYLSGQADYDPRKLLRQVVAPTTEAIDAGGCAPPVIAADSQACHCPAHGSWIQADDVKRLVREIDVTLNGEEGAAKQASLCDIAGQLKRVSSERGSRPVLEALSTIEQVLLRDAHKHLLGHHLEGPVDGCLLCEFMAERDQLQSEVAALRDAEQAAVKRSLVPGVMRCAKCNFRLVRNNLNMASGTVTAGGNETEPCPNGCGPLWPVTWSEDARDAQQQLEQIFLGVVGDVIRERQAQEAKWGQQNHPWLDQVLLSRDISATPERMAEEYEIPSETRAKFLCENAFNNGHGTYGHILVEEVAEAIAEQDEAKARVELIQVAAVAIAAVEAIDRRAAKDATP